jgi:ABC-2 type transport system ATP-binding protein
VLSGRDADGNDAQTRMGEALAARGVTCRPHGALIEIEPGAPPAGSDGIPEERLAAAAREHDALRDLIRDTAAELGLGLVRVQPQTGRLEDVFREEVAS